MSFSKDNYTIQDLVTNRTQNIHISNLRPYLYDDRYAQQFAEPRIVANADRQSFDVERIISHTGNRRKKSELIFRVRWAGYIESDDTYEPWSNLKGNAALHAYLRENHMASLIPKSYRVNDQNAMIVENDN